jgi:hypothetical protein
MRLDALDDATLRALAPWLAGGWRGYQSWELAPEGLELRLRFEQQRGEMHLLSRVDRTISFEELANARGGPQMVINIAWQNIAASLVDDALASLRTRPVTHGL